LALRCAGKHGERTRPRPHYSCQTEPGLVHCATSTRHLIQLAHQCLTATVSLKGEQSQSNNTGRRPLSCAETRDRSTAPAGVRRRPVPAGPAHPASRHCRWAGRVPARPAPFLREADGPGSVPAAARNSPFREVGGPG
jgi:hypothetical protein